MFRWCTERLKIKPTTVYIQNKISDHGEVIILLRTRSDESAQRAQSVKKHAVQGSRLRNHPLPNAKVFAPIADVTTPEVWTYLQAVRNPWTGDKNRELVTLYKDGSGGDCPLVMDVKTPSCGNSRFGCWVCTVVSRDKSMEALVDNGEKWMRPLIKIRDYLEETVHRDEGVEYKFEQWRMPVERRTRGNWSILAENSREDFEGCTRGATVDPRKSARATIDYLPGTCSDPSSMA